MDKHIVTFESLTKNDTDSSLNIIDKSLDLVNENYWRNENFLNIYFSRKKQFTVDENELKKEYDAWHKEIGRQFYNAETNKFIIDLLPFKQKIKSSNDILKYISFHPLLTFRDNKNINLIKKEISDRYFRNSVLNTVCGIFVISAFSRRQSMREKKPLSVVIRRNYLISISLLFISFIIIDFSFRLKKHNFLIKSLNEKNMTEKYFKNYL